MSDTTVIDEKDVLPETPQVTNEIVTLESMKSELSADTANVQAARVVSPTDEVESKLSDFVSDAFKATNKDLAFNEKLKDELISRLPSFTDNQLIALFSNNAVNTNDRISKLIAPTFQLMTATKNAEIVENAKARSQAANQVIVNTGNNQAGLNNDYGQTKEDTRDVMQGFNTLSNLLSALSSTDEDKKLDGN